MNITSHEEYGLRCAMQLAREHGKGPIAASKIAELEGISVEYVSKFMHLFRKAGLTTAVRGTQGGFQLVQSPENIVIQDVMKALDPKGSASKNFCEQFTGKRDVCVNFDQCGARPLWSLITFYFDSILGKITLKDLLMPESDVRSRIENVLSENLAQTRSAR